MPKVSRGFTNLSRWTTWRSPGYRRCMKSAAAVLDIDSDPFGEGVVCPLRTRAEVLGGVFDFESNDGSLLELVESAYKGLPAHAFSTEPPRFSIKLVLSSDAGPCVGLEPPAMRLHSGPGFLCGVMDAANFALVSPAQRAGSIAVSRGMLRHAQVVRYELIEFAVYTLASRAQRLVSLHAACIANNRRGLLLIGEGGAGKSTLTSQCLLQNMALVGEDAVLVEPGSLLASGVGTFLHLRADSLEFLPPNDDAWIRESPIIRRRSGVEKFQIDLRRSRFRIAPTSIELAAVIFLAPLRASEHELLAPLGVHEFMQRLTATQAYAANQAGWITFSERISGIRAFELRRGRHPSEGAEALRTILGGTTDAAWRGESRPIH